MKSKPKQVEKVSEIIAKSCGIVKPKLDPNLCKIFASGPKIIGKPESPQTPVSPVPNKADKKRKLRPVVDGSGAAEVKLSHRDAAAIRVGAKSKVTLKRSADEAVSRSKPNEVALPELKTKKRKKQYAEEDINPTENDAEQEPTLSGGNDPEVKRNEKKTHRELDAPKEKDEELERRTVFVGNVPKDIRKKIIKKIFRECGEIETIRFRGAAPAKPTLLKKVAFRKNQLHPESSSIVSYIRFKTRKEAKKAVKELNGYQMDDEHCLCVDLAIMKKRDNKKAVFVGNLNLTLHDNQLRSFFANCGFINNIRIIRDRETQLGKGFGYVNFENSDSVELALKLDGTDLEKRPIRIKRAVKKEKGKPKRSQGVKKRQAQNTGQSQTKVKPSVAKERSKVTPTPGKVKKEAFTGDCLAEIGKLKRKAKKPNKGDLKKARIIHKLTGVKPKGEFQKRFHRGRETGKNFKK